MQRMIVIIDEEKVKNSNEIFPYKEMLRAVDEICDESGLEKIGPHEYRPREGVDTLGCLLVVVAKFKANKSWIFKYLKEWTILDDENEIEDGLETFRREYPELFK